LAGPPLVGDSPSMRTVADLISRVGPTDLTVLITGESGTGKEVVARALHATSARASKPFVAVDCGAIPPSLVESELFGHEKGAFTGAESERKGLVEEAQGGTFFLDEIGDLDHGAQTRLLRLLQESEYRRVGDNKMRKADLRILAATNRNIEERVKEGLFREDLLHRLNVVRAHLPPLRDRREDVGPIFRYFVGRGALPVSDALVDRLLQHDWPGNVREVTNVARFVAGLAPGPVAQVSDLPPGFGAIRAPAGDPAAAVRTDLAYGEAKRIWTERFDEVYFARLLDAHGGNISAAARTADVDRKTIQRFLKRSGGEE
jgi:DNA-binding NtrC family response regulator